MMNIKKFAKLCNCNPQTLRYYDSINLLKPVNVDSLTGYRFYEEDQAIEYLKIRKLQEAEFTIEEIKELMSSENDKVYAALQRKIEEQKEKLSIIKNIQKSYHNDLKEMKQKIEEFKRKVLKNSKDVDYNEEFGIDEKEYYEILKNINSLLDQSSIYDKMSCDNDNGEEDDFVIPDGYKLIYDVYNYKRIKDVIDNIPNFNQKECIISVSFGEKYKGNFACLNVVLYKVLEKIGTNKKIELVYQNNTEKTFEIYVK